MTFADCDTLATAVRYVQLKNDGAVIDLLLVGEPRPRIGEFRGEKRTEFLFPVVDSEGLALWSVGVTMYRAIRDAWTSLHGTPFRLVRHGSAGDQGTSYTRETVADPAPLLDVAKRLDERDITVMLGSAVDPRPETPPADSIPF